MNKDVSFEEIINELEKITTQLESGSMVLEDAVNAYTNGIKLKELADTKLKDAYLRLQSVKENENLTKFRSGIVSLWENLQSSSIEGFKNGSAANDIEKLLEEFKQDYIKLYQLTLESEKKD
ncbi:MAG: exodeoxyribonuclease VII small subunit [Alphaproteobacteria bacterium]|nr:MAG: exodeoxyribonuclease VII small subunit [Alphaproteobacteria bacterium]